MPVPKLNKRAVAEVYDRVGKVSMRSAEGRVVPLINAMLPNLRIGALNPKRDME